MGYRLSHSDTAQEVRLLCFHAYCGRPSAEHRWYAAPVECSLETCGSSSCIQSNLTTKGPPKSRTNTQHQPLPSARVPSAFRPSIPPQSLTEPRPHPGLVSRQRPAVRKQKQQALASPHYPHHRYRDSTHAAAPQREPDAGGFLFEGCERAVRLERFFWGAAFARPLLSAGWAGVSAGQL